MAAMTWDFETGMQGFTWYTGHAQSAPGAYIAPGVTPDILGGGGIYGAEGGNLFMPGDGVSRSTAVFDLSSYLVGGKTSRFLLETDVYIPNLRDLTGFPNNYPGNMNQYAGMYMLSATSSWGAAMYGLPSKGAQVYTDYTADDAWAQRKKDWIMEEFTGGSPNVAVTPDSLWWNDWITLKLDYGFTTAGQVTAQVYLPWYTYQNQTGWITLYTGTIYANTWQAGLRDFSRIAIGDNPSTAGTPWTKCQWDNVYFDSPDLIPVPEPGSMLALGAGLMGLVGFARRRVS